jgi:transcriptional regulator with XRE-family HTH domain
VKTFAETLKRLMRDREVSAKLLSKATGIPQSSISEYLNGSRSATLGEPILKLAKFFGVSLEYLITGKHPEEEIVNGLVEDLEEGFTTIHRGVYRINIEKFSGKKPLKKSKDGDE